MDKQLKNYNSIREIVEYLNKVPVCMLTKYDFYHENKLYKKAVMINDGKIVGLENDE